jgi:hypothetical protein
MWPGLLGSRMQPLLGALCCRAFSPSDRAEGPIARSTGLQPCVRRCRKTRPERSPARFDPTFAADLSGRGFVGRSLGLKAQASCCKAFSPSDRAEGPIISSRAEGPTARSTGLQPCVRRCRKTRPERSPARFDPTFASDLSGRGFVGRFLGLKAQALCCRAFSPSDRAVCYSAFSLFRPACPLIESRDQFEASTSLCASQYSS